MADDEFQRDQPGLDGLAEAHVVGDEQVDPRHLDGPHHRVKLVVLDVDAAAERRLERPTSADEAAPQRTASRKASKTRGGSKPFGQEVRPSRALAPGSSSQMTYSSSPRPSSSTDESRNRC